MVEVRVPAANQTLQALKALQSASPSAVAHWCLTCGKIRLLNPEEVILAPGDPHCPEELGTGTPQQCVDAFAKAAGNTADTDMERLRTEMAALDDLLSRPTSNSERAQLLADRAAKTPEVEALASRRRDA
jgi:hypothetical protein